MYRLSLTLSHSHTVNMSPCSKNPLSVKPNYVLSWLFFFSGEIDFGFRAQLMMQPTEKHHS